MIHRGGLTLEEARYPEVETFADLPVASEFAGEVVLVCVTTGVIFVNHKRAGLYLSNGSNWSRMGVIQLAGTSIGYLPSNPPSGKYVITNLYARKIGDKYHPIMEVETTPQE